MESSAETEMIYTVLIMQGEKADAVFNAIEGCKHDMLVSELKDKFAKVADKKVDTMRFVCYGALCKEEDTLGDCGILANTPVWVVFVEGH